jgi:hypothetical protein
MWKKTHTKVYPGIKSQDVWKIWMDINNWPKWHSDLESCKLEGSFAVGNHFMLKPKGMGAVKILLTQIDEGRSFTDCTKFPGASMYDLHELEDTPAGLVMKNTLMVKGFLSFLWIKLVAQKVADSVPEEMDALVQYLQGGHE